MNKKKYRSIYKPLVVAVIFSPAIAYFIWDLVHAQSDISGLYELADIIVAIPALVSLIFFVITIVRITRIRKKKH